MFRKESVNDTPDPVLVRSLGRWDRRHPLRRGVHASIHKVLAQTPDGAVGERGAKVRVAHAQASVSPSERHPPGQRASDGERGGGRSDGPHPEAARVER
jgi:hypothetical protein